MNHQTSSDLHIAYQSPQVSTQLMTESPLVDLGFAVPVFSLGYDPIACLNKEMAFLTAVAYSRGDKGKVILVLVIRVMLLVLGETLQVDKQRLLNATTVKPSLLSESKEKKQLAIFKRQGFDNAVKIRTTPDARTEGEWGFEHTKAVFNNEIIPFLKSLKDIFNVFDKDLLNEIMEVQTVFDQMDAAVQQSSVDKQCLEIAKKELLLENDRLLQQIMSQDVLLTVMNSMSLNSEYGKKEK
ncbi:hypothetical protein Tco_1503427 [Tanacetum coccineum]